MPKKKLLKTISQKAVSLVAIMVGITFLNLFINLTILSKLNKLSAFNNAQLNGDTQIYSKLLQNQQDLFKK